MSEEHTPSPQSTDDSPQPHEQLNEASTVEPITETETPTTHNLQPTTSSNMEVHHHAHESHGKKNWKSYFWEFLMLFLAVFCGFLAEYQLEHTIERDREKVYIKNLYEDLKSDTIIYEAYSNRTIEFGTKIDSLFALLKSENRNAQLDKIHLLARTATMGQAPTLYPNKRAFSQLKNSGLLRLIHNQEVANAVSDYYLHLESIETQNETIIIRVDDYMKTIGGVLDAEVLFKIIKEEKEPVSGNLKLISENPVAVNQFLTAAQYCYGSRRNQSLRGLVALQKATLLIELVKKEYHLK